MLIRFNFSNYKSFCDENQLSLIKSKDRLLPEQTVKIREDLSLLNGCLIYGANASGKSNFISALEQAVYLIRYLDKNEKLLNFPRFVSDNSTSDESKFEFEFAIDKNIYSYGFVVNSKEVVEEWLYEYGRKKEYCYFTRENGKIHVLGENLKKEETDKLDSLKQFIRPNQLFLTGSIFLNCSVFENIKNWFDGILFIHPNTKPKSIPVIYSENETKKFLTYLLKSCDTGIEKIKFEEFDVNSTGIPFEILQDIKNNLDEGHYTVLTRSGQSMITIVKENGELKGKNLLYYHQSCSSPFLFENESDGTKRLIELAPALIDNKVHLLIIDEIDRSIHPSLTTFLTKSLMCRNEFNQKQIIVSTHETSLLNTDWIRRDAIWFVNKDNFTGKSSLKPLSDFNVRFDKELRRAYLDGRYYGVPKLGDNLWSGIQDNH